jgi:hypothetical protein
MHSKIRICYQILVICYNIWIGYNILLVTRLQHCLDSLQNYCSDWRLTVSLNKTKIMIFSKKMTEKNLFHFYYGPNTVHPSKETPYWVISGRHVCHAQWYILYYYYSKKKRGNRLLMRRTYFWSMPLPVMRNGYPCHCLPLSRHFIFI